MKFVDPTGHCAGKADDPSNPDLECWSWKASIESTYSNIEVIPDLWTAEELKIVWNALAGHVFISDIRDVSKITLRREIMHFAPDGSGPVEWVAGYTYGVKNDITVSIYDAAWRGGSWFQEGDHDAKRFEHTIIHEFAHVAHTQNEKILQSFQDNGGGNWFNGKTETWNAGWQRNNAELLAELAVVWQQDPGQFSRNSWFGLGAVEVDWRKAWIETFYTPNPVAGPYALPRAK